MRIVFLAAIGPGASTLIGRTLPLARRLAPRHETHIVCLADGSAAPPHRKSTKQGRRNFDASSPAPPPKIWIAGPALVHKEEGGKKSFPSRLPALLARLRQGERGLLHKLKELAPDFLVIVKAHPQNMLAAWLYLRRHTVPAVLDLDDDERANPLMKTWQRWLHGRMENRLVPRLAGVWTATPPLFAQWQSRTRTLFLPTGIDLPLRTQPLPIPRQPGIVYLGTLSQHTGHRLDLLIAATQKIRRALPQTTLHLWGEGEDTDYYHALARRQGILKNVIFHGAFEPADSTDILRSASVLADPVDDTPAAAAKSSYRATEALRCGVPIVAGATGIRTRLLARVSRRCLVKPDDATQLAKKLLWHLKHPSWRYEFWAATRETAHAVHWDALAARVLGKLPEFSGAASRHRKCSL